MDVILLKSVDNLGDPGAEVSVARGFARNYLIPQGLAVIVTAGHRKMVAEQIRLEEKRDALRKTSAEEIAQTWRAKELSCEIQTQAGDDDKLFGSVTTRDIAAALANREVEVDHKQVLLDEPIKQLGVYTVPIKLHRDVQAEVKVWVIRA